MRLLRKKRRVPVLMFQDPFVGMRMACRLAERFGFCSRWKGSAGNGGEKRTAAGCPGSSLAAAEMKAGAGCNAFDGGAR